jgi:ATP-dependent RNA helicase RhlE
MVRSIEQVLKAKIERRTIEGFDYKVPAPRKDAEFARPPREPRSQPKSKAAQPKPAVNKAAAPAVSKSKPAVRPEVVKTTSGNPSAPGSSRHPRRAGRAR